MDSAYPSSVIPAHHALLALLAERGATSSADLQAALGKSQPTVSRLLREFSPQVLVLGRGKRARYALPQAIRGMPAQQPLWWTNQGGRIERWGTLSFLTGSQLHVEAQGIDLLVRGGLPWFLAPMRPHGFLGRLLAERLAHFGLDANPERWSLEDTLFAAQSMHDAPGAILLGDHAKATPAHALPIDRLEAAYEDLARDVAAGLPAGSSAGGEQAKFLARLSDDRHVLVKFSPPRGTPFGDRWTDLLRAECLALQVLEEAGFSVARSRMIDGPVRGFLESERFDRTPPGGRLHVVALDAIHDAFVAGPRQHWAASCEALARQRRLPREEAERVEQLLHFGRLIGNTDMHFGNLSLWVDDLSRGRFRLAPIYDMLPMRYRPDASTGQLDLAPFDPDFVALGSVARAWAKSFWQRVNASHSFSPGFRALARTMEERLAA